jgi:osmoprotectant transport system permease protein
METIQGLLEWFGEAEQMSGSGAIPVRVLEHLQLTLSAVAAAMIPAVGLGIYIGHSRRFEFITITVANLGRALPSFAILAFFFPISLQLGLGLGFWPTFIALFFLAIPPILTNAYVGIKEVDRDAVESATGMGMSGTEVLRSIEIPLAMPLIITGIRTSAVQVIATATLAALVAGGGLGRYIVDGFAVGDTAEILGGAILVASLAIVSELAFGFIERAATPRTSSSARNAPIFPPVEVPGPGITGTAA